MESQTDELFLAGRLLQWALRSDTSPTRFEEYGALIERYLDRLEFRDTVKRIAAGLGLEVLPDVRRGFSIVLAPCIDSVFAMHLPDYRSPSNNGEDDRLLDGLIHLAIAATIYPRAADLLEDPTLSRNLVSVDEIEETLRRIADRLEEQSRTNPDPVISGAEGLYEAWRVYKSRPATKETRDNRSAPKTTRRSIEQALDYLCRQHCFKLKGAAYQPLWRYNVLMQEYAASSAYRAIQNVLDQQIRD